MQQQRQQSAPAWLLTALARGPQARALLMGDRGHPDLRGEVRFYQTIRGSLVVSEFTGLPRGGGCACGVFGFHIHEGGMCRGDAADPFAMAGGHWNPGGCLHPCHAGDMPPIFGNRGSAFSAFLTERFQVREVLGKTVILHAMPDDLRTQPAGASGRKIACGEIKRA